MPTADDFREALNSLFVEEAKKGKKYIEVRSGDLHRNVGGYPGTNHAMPTCCKVMERERKAGDTILQSPPKGNGASLVIRYMLPRQEIGARSQSVSSFVPETKSIPTETPLENKDDRIYITHCSATKDERLKESKEKVTPDDLYISPRIQSFIQACQAKNAKWAIFSDQYGIVFPEDKIAWYEKSPDSVSPQEYLVLLGSFIQRLAGFNEIHFYYNPGRFHSLYSKLVTQAKSVGMNIVLFSSISDIQQ
jgi:hypothetical protein